AIDLINNNLSKLMTLLLILAAILSFISFALIRNTVRLSIYSKRFLIHTMKLVGATPAFIRNPFLVHNVYTGIAAGILANGIIWLIITYFTKEYFSVGPIVSFADLV